MKTALNTLATLLLMTSASAFAQGGHDIGNANAQQILNLKQTDDLTGYKIEIEKYDQTIAETAVFVDDSNVQFKFDDGIVCRGTYDIKRPRTDFVWHQQARAYLATSYTPSSEQVEESNARLKTKSDLVMKLDCSNGRSTVRIYRLHNQMDISNKVGALTGWYKIIPFTEEDGQIESLNITRTK